MVECVTSIPRCFLLNSMNYNAMLNENFLRRRSPALAAGLAVLLSLAIVPAWAGPAEDVKEASRLYQQGKLDNALTKVDAALAQQPKDAQGRFVKGLILTEQKKSADAIQIFTGLTEDYPELPEPYNNLAVLYASQGNYDKAKAALELAIHTHPAYATAYENLGDIYAQLARRSYDKALQLDKSNTTAQSKLAMVKDLFVPPKTVVADGTKPVATTVAKAEPAKAPSARTPEPAAAAVVGADAQVRATVAAWAKAWAGKDVPAYLAAYAPDFETPAGLTRAAWEAQRTERINAAKSISVGAKISKVTIDGNEATVVFRQAYKSDKIVSNNTKTMRMIKSGENWLIRSERAGG